MFLRASITGRPRTDDGHRSCVKQCGAMRSASPDQPQRSPVAALAALGVAIAAIALGHWFAYRPGIMVWDSIRQYGQALSGKYDDWHPPAMNWLWHELLRFGRGPGPMLVAQLALYWGGIGLLALAALRRRRWALSAAIVAVALLPISLVLIGTILKDSLMAGCLLMVAGILALRPAPSNGARAAIALLLIAAASLRFNAVPAIVPLALAALPPRWIETRTRLAAAGIGLAIALLAVMPIANRMLDAKSSGVEYSLITYDLGGITQFTDQDAFPPMPPVTDPRPINAGCYNSISWDRYAWWGDAPCAIGFETVRAAFAANRQSPTRWWLSAIVHHPLAYARHRLGHFNRNIRLWTSDSSLPTLSLKSDPNDWNLKIEPNLLNNSINRLATVSERSPLGWPAWWIGFGAAVLMFWPASRHRAAGAPLLWSGLLYAFSFLPLSVATEVRYHLWTMLAIGIGTLQALDSQWHRQTRAWPIAKVITSIFGITAVCIAARWWA